MVLVFERGMYIMRSFFDLCFCAESGDGSLINRVYRRVDG